MVGQGRAGTGIFMPPSVFWALSIAPGKVDLVGERMGEGEGNETPSPSHADLCPKHWSLCECRVPQSPSRLL